MSNKNHNSNMKLCKCNKCGAEALSVAGKQHRRCGGTENAPLRPKHEGIDPAAGRGRWA